MITATRRIDPQLERALRAAREAEQSMRPTRLGDVMLARLIDAGLVYVTSVQRRVDLPARLFVHLTRDGCEALGIDPGLRR